MSSAFSGKSAEPTVIVPLPLACPAEFCVGLPDPHAVTSSAVAAASTAPVRFIPRPFCPHQPIVGVVSALASSPAEGAQLTHPHPRVFSLAFSGRRRHHGPSAR